jgi:hypothetical protein
VERRGTLKVNVQADGAKLARGGSAQGQLELDAQATPVNKCHIEQRRSYHYPQYTVMAETKISTASLPDLKNTTDDVSRWHHLHNPVRADILHSGPRQLPSRPQIRSRQHETRRATCIRICGCHHCRCDIRCRLQTRLGCDETLDRSCSGNIWVAERSLHILDVGSGEGRGVRGRERQRQGMSCPRNEGE